LLEAFGIVGKKAHEVVIVAKPGIYNNMFISTRSSLMTSTLKIGFLLYPYLTQLDLTGPAQVFASAENVQIELVWKDLNPVKSDAQFSLLPTQTFETCPNLDVLCVPGGPGQQRIMQDTEVISWLKRQGMQAKWITSVCSGSLLLGAAGLLSGYRAAGHWNYRHYLSMYGATPDESRVVADRNRITGGGVTAGIDFALGLLASLRGDEQAKEIQLLLEYAPEPPFNAGRPDDAGPELVVRVQKRLNDAVAALKEAPRALPFFE
jgi:cyclohexyl-isocyanide hydratase